MHIWGQFSQPLVGEGVEAEVLPNNPEAAPRGGVRHTRGGARTGSTFTHQLFVRLNAVTPDLDFTHRITPEYSVLIGIKHHPRESCIHRWGCVVGEKKVSIMGAHGWSSVHVGLMVCGYFAFFCGELFPGAEAGCRERENPNCCTGRNNDCFEYTRRKTVCYCDTYCQKTGDCCEDYQRVCQISGECCGSLCASKRG